jgi:hypothetical protein
MGAGMLAIVPDGRAAVDVLRSMDIDAWACGVITEQPGVRLLGLARDQ